MNIVGRPTSKFKGCPSEGLLPTLERPSISSDLLAVLLTHRRSPFGHPLGMSLFPLSLDVRRLAFRPASLGIAAFGSSLNSCGHPLACHQSLIPQSLDHFGWYGFLVARSAYVPAFGGGLFGRYLRPSLRSVPTFDGGHQAGNPVCASQPFFQGSR